MDQEQQAEQRRMEDIDAQIKKLTNETNALKNKWAPPHTGGLTHSLYQCPGSVNLCYACQAVTEQTCVLLCGHSKMTAGSGTSIPLNLEDQAVLKHGNLSLSVAKTTTGGPGFWA